MKFIFNEIPVEIERIIKEADKELLLVSPFIDLSPNIKDILKLRKSDHNLHIRILFGKSDGDFTRSFKQDSVDFLKEFPNLEIRYEERLHAKVYVNDFDFMLTSMNLYNYSLNKNIESGVVFNYASKSALGKLKDVSIEALNSGLDKVFGDNDGTDPLEAIEDIYSNASVMLRTQAKLKEKKGLLSGFKKDELEGVNIVEDNFSKPELPVSKKETKNEVKSIGKKLSLSKLSKSTGKTLDELKVFVESEQLVADGEITTKGKELGLELKSYMGNSYIAYPENIFN